MICKEELIHEIILFCKAHPLYRPRKGGSSNHIYQPLDNQAEQINELEMYESDDYTINFPVIVECSYFFSTNEGKHLDHVSPSDVDNLLKATLDHLVRRGFITDDRLVLRATAEKDFSDEYRIEINIYRARAYHA